MRYLTTTPLLLALFPTFASAQGLIRGPEQSVEATRVPAAAESLPVAVDGDRLAIHEETFLRVGDQWLPAAPLTGATLAVAADGGRFVNGDRSSSFSGVNRSGIARVQRPTPGGWQVEGVLLPSDLRPRLDFGAAVAIAGDTVAVLASGWRPVGQSASDAVGAVYVFRETPGGWVEEALLPPLPGDRFAFPNGRASIALDGDVLVVTGRDAQPAGGSLPTVFVFQRAATTWSLATALVLPNGAADGATGMYVDVQEDVPGAFASIAVHSLAIGRVFTGYGASWQSQSIADGTWRGPVAFSGSVLAVADPADDVAGGSNEGSVHLYQRDSAGTWLFQTRLVSIEPGRDSYFGANLDLDGETLAVASGRFVGNAAAPLDPTVDVFRVLPVGATEYCAGLPNSTGEVARIASSGSTSIAANQLELVAGRAPTGTGLFFYGTGQVQLPFGDGFRCVGSDPTYRLPQRPVSGGLLTYDLDFTAPPLAGGQILPGSTWNFQALYRDGMAGGAGFNTSTGLALSFQP